MMIWLSRPSMWAYTALSFVLGLLSGLIRYLIVQKTNWLSVSFWLEHIRSSLLAHPSSLFLLILLFFYFLFPANLLIHGVNDLFDYDTDRINTFKQKQKLQNMSDSMTTRQTILLWNIVFLFVIVVSWWVSLAPDFGNLIWLLVLFIFFAIFYSAPPIRAKWVPFLDGLFKLIYIVPALVWYIWMFGSLDNVNPLVLLASLLFIMATHAFAAIPDIYPDKHAWIKTTAVFLWRDLTLVYCAVLYFFMIMFTYPVLWPIAIIVWLLYMSLISFAFFQPKNQVCFKRFPYVNSLVLLLLNIRLVSLVFW